MNANELSSRRKVIYINHQQLLRLLLGHKIFANHVVVPVPKGLPDTAVIQGMFLAQDRNGYGVTICDESFEQVAGGELSPELHIEWTVVDIQRPEGNEKP